MKKFMLALLVFSSLQSSALIYHQSTVIAYQEKTIHPKDLPENIRKYVTDNYNGASITKATFKESGGSVTEYTVHINYRQEVLILKFDRKGEFVRKE